MPFWGLIINHQLNWWLLDRVHELIAMRKKQLAKLELLVKARFVELFNSHGSGVCCQKGLSFRKGAVVSSVLRSCGRYSGSYPHRWMDFCAWGFPILPSFRDRKWLQHALPWKSVNTEPWKTEEVHGCGDNRNRWHGRCGKNVCLPVFLRNACSIRVWKDRQSDRRYRWAGGTAGC